MNYTTFENWFFAIFIAIIFIVGLGFGIWPCSLRGLGCGGGDPSLGLKETGLLLLFMALVWYLFFDYFKIVSPESTSDIQARKVRRKYIVLFVSICLIVAITFLVIMNLIPPYRFSVVSPVNSQQNLSMQNQNIQTATWKTYTNTAYGFEVKYPLGVQISSTGPNDAQQSLSQGEQISGTVSPSYDIIVFSQNNNEIGEIGVFNISNTLTSNVVKTGKPFSQEDYIKNYLYLQGPCDVRWDFKENSINQINLNNITALEVKGTSGLDNFSCYYIANNPGLLLVMSTKNNLGIFDTIISTFKFTK